MLFVPAHRAAFQGGKGRRHRARWTPSIGISSSTKQTQNSPTPYCQSWVTGTPRCRGSRRRWTAPQIRHLGENYSALDAQGAQESGAGQRWAAFLNNHREAIAAMDSFTVSTLTFGRAP